MGKMKELVIEITEMLQDGYTIAQVSDFTGLPQDVVFDIAWRYSAAEPEAEGSSL
jgi:hypothetical protein